MATKAQIRANNKYRDKTYDRLELTLSKGKKADIKKFASEKGESTNSFIIRLIDEAMDADEKKADT